MKSNLTAILVATLLIANSHAAVFTVSNAAGGGAQYTQIDDAISAASAGDTIYVKGTSFAPSNSSSTMYNNATITKSLTLIGSGAFVQKQIPLISFVNAFTINSNLDGITIKGFAFYNGVNMVGKTLINNINLSENFFYVSGISMSGASNLSNLSITNNIFNGDISCPVSPTCFNLIISNNLIGGHLNGILFSNATVQNNVFYYPNNGGNVCNAGINTGVVFKNNIFYHANASANTASCTFTNNITYHATITYSPLGASNIDNTNPLFVNPPTSNVYVASFNFNLQATSPCINAGSDGTNMGYYGGAVYSSTTGEPQNVPVMRQMDVLNTNVPAGGNLNVKVRSTKAR